MGARAACSHRQDGVRGEPHGPGTVDDALGCRHVSYDVAVVDGEPRWWRHATETRREAPSIIGPCTRENDPGIGVFGRGIPPAFSRATPDSSTPRPSCGRMIEVQSAHERSMAGPLWGRLGRCARALYQERAGTSPIKTARRYSVVLFGRTVRAIAIRRQRSWRQVRRLPVSRACRSRFTRTRNPSATPCRPAAFDWPCQR